MEKISLRHRSRAYSTFRTLLRLCLPGLFWAFCGVSGFAYGEPDVRRSEYFASDSFRTLQEARGSAAEALQQLANNDAGLHGVCKITLAGEWIARYQSKHHRPPWDRYPVTDTYYVDIASDKLLALATDNADTIGELWSGGEHYQWSQTNRQYRKLEWSEPTSQEIHTFFPPLLAFYLHENGDRVFDVRAESDGANVIYFPASGGAVSIVDISPEGRILRISRESLDPTYGTVESAWTFSEYGALPSPGIPGRIVQTVRGDPTRIYDVAEFDCATEKYDNVFTVPISYRDELVLPSQNFVSVVEKIGPGLFRGPTYQRSLFVEFNEFVVVVDLGTSAKVAKETLMSVDKLTGGKPLKYAVSTHYHPDHNSALPIYVSVGAEIIAPREYQDFMRSIYSVAAQQVSTLKVPLVLSDPVELPRISDGVRTLELYEIPNAHANAYVVGYLRDRQMLFGADVFWFSDSSVDAPVDDAFCEFATGLSALNLEIKTMVNAHGRIAATKEFHLRASQCANRPAS